MTLEEIREKVKEAVDNITDKTSEILDKFHAKIEDFYEPVKKK